MSSPKRISLLEFFQQRVNGGEIIRELYQEVLAVFYRQNVSWVTFLYTDELIKTKFRECKQYQNFPDDCSSYSVLF